MNRSQDEQAKRCRKITGKKIKMGDRYCKDIIKDERP